jgi:putative sigma-54 modulation protein
MPIRTLTQDEATMKFELSGDDFLIFKSEEDLKTKVMFRRKDQNLGVIQVE